VMFVVIWNVICCCSRHEAESALLFIG
jgi:hypothetical protein